MTKKNDNPFNASRTFEAVLREHHLIYPECANKLTKVGDKYIAVLNKDYWPKTSLADKVTSAHQNTARYFGEHMHGEDLMPFGIGHKDNIVMYAFSDKNDAMYFMDFVKDPEGKTYEQFVSALEKAAGKNNGKRNYLPMLLQSYVQRHFDDPGFLREPMKPLFDRLEKDYNEWKNPNTDMVDILSHSDAYRAMAERHAGHLMVNSIIDNTTFDVPCQTHLPRPVELAVGYTLTGFRHPAGDSQRILMPLIVKDGKEVARMTDIVYKDYYEMYHGMTDDERSDLRLRMHTSDTMQRAGDYVKEMLLAKKGEPMTRDAYNFLSDLSYMKSDGNAEMRQLWLNMLLAKAQKEIAAAPRSVRWSSAHARLDECAAFMKEICNDEVTHVKDKVYTIEDITDLCFEHIPSEDGKSVFFRVETGIHECLTGNYAHHVAGDGLEGKEVRTLGVLLAKNPEKCRLLYRHEHRMENGQNYHTVLGRQIDELSQGEMKGLFDAFKEVREQRRTLPMVIDEDVYTEGREDPLYSISSEEPYDGEQHSVADEHNVDEVRKSGNEYLFNDYDDAILFAYDNTKILTSRGQIIPIGESPILSQNKFNWKVSYNGDNLGLKALTEAHHGECETHLDDGAPVIIARFHSREDAKAYRDDTTNISPTDNRLTRAVDAAVERITSTTATAFTRMQLARIGYETYAFNGPLAAREATERFITILQKDERLKGVEPAWIDSAVKDIRDFAKGKEIAVEREASIKY